MDSYDLAQTAAGAALFAGAFIWGNRLRPLKHIVTDRHIVTSMAAGMSSAYVFVHVLPELSHAREMVVHAVAGPLPNRGALVYFVALIGFLLFYGLNELDVRLLRGSAAIEAGVRALSIHIAGFSVYVGLVSYLLVRGLGETAHARPLYIAALGLHFLTVDLNLREMHGAPYDRWGRFVLAAMAIAGWACGVAVQLGAMTLAFLLAFVSGGVIVNSTIMELPAEKHGRFLPFLAGGLLYGLLLLVLA